MVRSRRMVKIFILVFGAVCFSAGVLHPALLAAGLSSNAQLLSEGHHQPDGPRLTRRSTLVFDDDFSSGTIDPDKWHHAVTGDGGGGHEFNMYTPEADNSFVRDGVLYIKPTLTVDRFGQDFLKRGYLNVRAIWGTCTQSKRNGCSKSGQLNIPVTMSAKLTTKAHIFYGRVEVVAQLPKGDWLWPAIWMLPSNPKYGHWPRSGEIDIMEARGNLRYSSPQGWQMNPAQVITTLHYGLNRTAKKSRARQYTMKGATFADDFHTYWLDWTADYLIIGVDNHTMMTYLTPPYGFWQRGRFKGDNIWANGGKNAPFDQPFHLILNVAVGGDWFKSKYRNRPYLQPWHDDWHNYKMTEFWNSRNLWIPTWKGDDVAMKIKSVKMIQYS